MTTAFYEYVVQIYDLLLEQSKLNEYEEQIFEGKLTEVFRQAGTSSTYYSPIRDLLLTPLNDPCIEIRQRGNSKQPSIILLRHPPPQEWEAITHRDLTRRGDAATLPVEVERGEERLARLESWRESIGEVNLSEFIRSVESRLTRLEQERGKRDNGETEKV